MLIDSIDLGIGVSIAGGLGLLLAAACVDRYQSRRRDTALNAAYLARIRANRINSQLPPIELSCGSARFLANSGSIQMLRKEQIRLEAPGIFSRRTIFSDSGGRVLAAQYEEFVVDGLANDVPSFQTPRLMLAH
jgi:hypothetical protein